MHILQAAASEEKIPGLRVRSADARKVQQDESLVRWHGRYGPLVRWQHDIKQDPFNQRERGRQLRTVRIFAEWD